MPLLFTPRNALIAVSFTLITFFWTFGLPRPLAEPALPIIDDSDLKNVHTEPKITTPDEHATALGNAAPLAKGVPILVDTKQKPYKEIKEPPTHDVADFCKDVKGAQHVMVVIRTSKYDLKKKLPTHLKNLLECVPNFAIFSDHEGEIEGYKVHNSLKNISDFTKRAHKEFEEYQILHADPEHKPELDPTVKLDKWKFLPMVYQAYHLRTSARFFLFIEPDTSLTWTNFLQWVNRLDFRIPYHCGAPKTMGDIQISQRGPGILLSQAAIRRYVKSYDELYDTKWEAQIAKECCGDQVLSMALNDAHVELYSAWPLLQDKEPDTFTYSQKVWCAPAVTWHRLLGDDLSGMWENEKKWVAARGWEEPYLFRDAFHDHLESHLAAQRVDWDNLSQDGKILSPEGRQLKKQEEEARKRKAQEEEAQKKKAEQDAEAKKKAKEEREKKAKEAEEQRKKAEQETADTKEPKAKRNTIGTKPNRNAKPDDAKPKKSLRKRDDPPKEVSIWEKLTESFPDAGVSAENCEKTCTDVPDCVQWRYTTSRSGECHLSKVWALGRKGDGNMTWTSGWLTDRAASMAEKWKCNGVEWRFYQ